MNYICRLLIRDVTKACSCTRHKAPLPFRALWPGDFPLAANCHCADPQCPVWVPSSYKFPDAFPFFGGGFVQPALDSPLLSRTSFSCDPVQTPFSRVCCTVEIGPDPSFLISLEMLGPTTGITFSFCTGFCFSWHFWLPRLSQPMQCFKLPAFVFSLCYFRSPGLRLILCAKWLELSALKATLQLSLVFSARILCVFFPLFSSLCFCFFLVCILR